MALFFSFVGLCIMRYGFGWWDGMERGVTVWVADFGLLLFFCLQYTSLDASGLGHWY